VNPLQELGIDKILFLTESLFIIKRRMVPQPPEIIRIIAVGSLKARQLIFFRKEDGRACHQDQLFSERIETKCVDIGGALWDGPYPNAASGAAGS
jgi:hypothetical protein